MLTIAELQAGVIFGDNNTREDVYMPGSAGTWTWRRLCGLFGCVP